MVRRVLMLALLSSLYPLRAAPSQPQPVFAYVPDDEGGVSAFRVSDATGELTAVPGKQVKVGTAPQKLVVSANRRYLYAYPYSIRDRSGKTKATPVTVLMIRADGALTPVQTLSVPTLIGDLKAHPGGRFLYALAPRNSAVVLAVDKRGHLSLRERHKVAYGVDMRNTVGLHQDCEIAFSPEGNYLYNFNDGGFLDHEIFQLQRFHVNRDSGTLTPDGPEWGEKEKLSAGIGYGGRVLGFRREVAFVEGEERTVWSHPVKAGRILPTSFPASGSLPSDDGTRYGYALHPFLPLVYCRKEGESSYSVRRAMPGGTQPVGAFASATGVPDADVRSFVSIDPTGRFFYEIAGTLDDSENSGVSVRIAVLRLRDGGAKAEPSVPAKPAPSNVAWGLLTFVARPH